MTSGREITPLPGFSTIPITTTMFAATTPENTPMAYRASTSTNPNPVISLAFVEANYEALESLLRDRRRQIHNNDLRTKLEYFSEDYDEEREMEPRPEPTIAATLPLRVTSPRGGTPLEETPRGNGGQSVNLPPLLAAHLGRSENGQPLQSSLTSAYGGNLPMRGIPAHLPQDRRTPQTFTNSNMPSQNGAVLNPVGLVTPFVHWIEDYPLPDGLKMPSYIYSYDGKGDPDNFLHLFEGAIRMQKCSILDYEDLKAKFRSHFSQQKKFKKTHLAVHNIKQREGESTQASITRYTDGQKNKDRFSPYRGPNHALLPSLSKSPKEILATKKAVRSFEPPPKMFGRESKRDKGTTPAKAPILMVSREAYIAKSLAQENTDYEGKEIIFPLVAKVNNAPVIIEAKIFGRKVGRVYMDNGSSCEIIYEHYFEKLNPTIKATKVDLKTPLVGFLGERSWSIDEVPHNRRRPPLKDINS
ncbi:hypothetical protein Tco_1132812 [Tanacetum coccineum]|uniref:Reverse transcriptase domain-containing protein n=1 Tax=Tanacetum coccineum TaxID=301880 RepID=A0ABQ5JE25_9ASTR